MFSLKTHICSIKKKTMWWILWSLLSFLFYLEILQDCARVIPSEFIMYTGWRNDNLLSNIVLYTDRPHTHGYLTTKPFLMPEKWSRESNSHRNELIFWEPSGTFQLKISPTEMEIHTRGQFLNKWNKFASTYSPI